MAPVVLVVILFGVLAWPVQEIGWTQKANYALVRSLADGTPRIDRYHLETGDKSFVDGHFYSVKAPGLAMVSVPPYVALERTGLLPHDERTAIWLLNLLTVVPFALLLFAVAARAAERLGGTGTLAGTAVVIATLVLPFSTLYFTHVPAAALVMLAFLLAMRCRATASPAAAVAAGTAAALAIVFEYPSGLACAAIGVFAVWTSTARVRTAAAYAAGAIVGLLPLAAYNAWAFGSVTRLSYQHVVDPRDWLEDRPRTLPAGSLGFSFPRLDTTAELLLSSRGLLVTTPILAVGIVGAALLYRIGRRAEATLIGGVALASLAWNSGFTEAYGGPFGGDSPGARYIVCVVPLVLLPLGLVLRRAAPTALLLGGISAAVMAVVTATEPQVGATETGQWHDLLRHGSFTETPLTLLGADVGWAAMLPFFVGLAVIAAAAWRSAGCPRRGSRLGAAASLGAWVVIACGAPRLLTSPGGTAGAALALLLVAVVSCVAAYAHTGGDGGGAVRQPVDSAVTPAGE